MLGLILMLLLACTGWGNLEPRELQLLSAEQAVQDGSSTPTPAFDRLAEPTLPANPTQEQLGSYLYYYHCMPCHGDRGQGLTDEWRQVWVEDHRNCWARGCHGGRMEDEGFPIPKEVPAVILANGASLRFGSSSEVAAYLKSTHPPQEPGRLKDEEYQALAVYLWSANGSQDANPEKALRNNSRQSPGGNLPWLKWTVLGFLVCCFLVIFGWLIARNKVTRNKNLYNNKSD